MNEKATSWYQWRLAIDFPQIIQFPASIRTDPLVIRYAYAHLGTHKPTLSHPPVSITTLRPDVGGEALLPNAFCAYECLASQADISAIFDAFPLELAIWTAPAEAKREAIAYARIDLASLWQMEPIKDHKAGPPALPPIAVLHRSIDTFIALQGVKEYDGMGLGFIRAVVTLEQLGEPIPASSDLPSLAESIRLQPGGKAEACLDHNLLSTQSTHFSTHSEDSTSSASVPSTLLAWRSEKENELKAKWSQLKAHHLRYLKQQALQRDQSYEVSHANLHHSVVDMEQQLLPALDRLKRRKEELDARILYLNHQNTTHREWREREQRWCQEQSQVVQQEQHQLLQNLRHEMRTEESEYEALSRRHRQLEQALIDVKSVKETNLEASQKELSARQSSREMVTLATRELDQTQRNHRELQALIQRASSQLAQERSEIVALEAGLHEQIKERTRKAEQQKMRMHAKAYWNGELMAPY